MDDVREAWGFYWSCLRLVGAAVAPLRGPILKRERLEREAVCLKSLSYLPLLKGDDHLDSIRARGGKRKGVLARLTSHLPTLKPRRAGCVSPSPCTERALNTIQHHHLNKYGDV